MLILKKGYGNLSNAELFAPVNKMPVKDAKNLVQYYKGQYEKAKKNGYKKSYNTFVKEMGWGAGIDLHKTTRSKKRVDTPLPHLHGPLQPPRTAAEI